MSGKSFLDVYDILQHPLPSGLFSSRPIEHLFCLLVVCQHALEFRVDITVELQELVVSDFENSLSVALAQDLLDLFV